MDERNAISTLETYLQSIREYHAQVMAEVSEARKEIRRLLAEVSANANAARRSASRAVLVLKESDQERAAQVEHLYDRAVHDIMARLARIINTGAKT